MAKKWEYLVVKFIKIGSLTDLSGWDGEFEDLCELLDDIGEYG